MRKYCVLFLYAVFFLTLSCTASSSNPKCEINVKQYNNKIPNKSGTYNFGQIEVNANSNVITFTIENNGVLNLNLTGSPDLIGINGPDSSMFIIDQTMTQAEVASRRSTEFDITFQPTSSGLKTATITIPNDDSDENPYTFTITGTGIEKPEINIKQNNTDIVNNMIGYDFGIVNFFTSSPAITFTIENLGSAALELKGSPDYIEISGTDAAMFSINQSNTTGNISPGNSTTFEITFTPISIGDKTATITIANDDSNENPYTFEIVGKGEQQNPEIYVRQDTLKISGTITYFDFGIIVNGETSRIKPITIQNIGQDPLILTGTPKISLTGTDVSSFVLNQTMTSSPIAPGSETTFEIQFVPTSLGEKTATISIDNNDHHDNPCTFSIQGKCVDFTPGTGIGFFGGNYDGWRRYGNCPWNTIFKYLYNPSDVYVDSNGNIYVAEGSNPRISKWDKDGYALGWIGGGSDGWKKTLTFTPDGKDYQSFSRPTGIYLDSNGNIYIADVDNNRVCKWDSNGNAIGWIGGGSNGWKTSNAPASSGTDYQSFDHPTKLFVDSSGNLFISDHNNHRICKWDSNGNAIGWIGGGSNGWKTTNAPSTYAQDYQSFRDPCDVCIDSSGNLYIADYNNYRVSKWDKDGNAIGWIGGGSNGWKTTSATGAYGEDYQSFTWPTSVHLSSSGFLYISDVDNDRVCKWNVNGTAVGWIGGDVDGWKTRDSVHSDYGSFYRKFHSPIGLFADSAGYVYIADSANDRISKWMD